MKIEQKFFIELETEEKLTEYCVKHNVNKDDLVNSILSNFLQNNENDLKMKYPENRIFKMGK